MAKTAGPRKLYQQVAQALIQAVRDGVFPPGARLPGERDLAEQHGVSRPTIREAMIALELQGVVEARHGSGIYVLDARDPLAQGADLDIGAFELTEARRILEGEVCAHAALTIEDETLERLEALLAEMTVEVAASRIAPDHPGDQADRRFHLLIAEATRNSALVLAVQMLWDLRYRSPLCREMLTRARLSGDRPRTEEHRAIVQALRARDPAAARQAMRDHLDRVIEGLFQATESEAVRQARQDAAARRDAYALRRAI